MGIAPLPSLSLCTGGFHPSSPLPHTPSACGLLRAPACACGLAPSWVFLGWACDLALSYVRARQACGLELLYIACGLTRSKNSDRLATLIEALLDAGASFSRQNIC